MNAPTALSHLVPEINQREVPAALIDALKARFGANCSTALVVREQHGRDESLGYDDSFAVDQALDNMGSPRDMAEKLRVGLAVRLVW